MMGCERINCHQVAEFIEQDHAKIFDVRDEHAFNKGHIEQAEYLPREKFNTVCEQLNKQSPLLIYCYLGNRSKQIAELFTHYGFEKVYSLEGGFAAWQAFNK